MTGSGTPTDDHLARLLYEISAQVDQLRRQLLEGRETSAVDCERLISPILEAIQEEARFLTAELDALLECQ